MYKNYIYNNGKLFIDDGLGNFNEREVTSNNMLELLSYENTLDSINGYINGLNNVIEENKKLINIKKIENCFMFSYPFIMTLVVLIVMILSNISEGLLETSLLSFTSCSLINVPIIFKRKKLKKDIDNAYKKLELLEDYKESIQEKINILNKNMEVDKEKIDLEESSCINHLDNNMFDDEIYNIYYDKPMVLKRKLK